MYMFDVDPELSKCAVVHRGDKNSVISNHLELDSITKLNFKSWNCKKWQASMRCAENIEVFLAPNCTILLQDILTLWILELVVVLSQRFEKFFFLGTRESWVFLQSSSHSLY